MAESPSPAGFRTGASASSDPERPGFGSIQLAVVIPTLNERENVGPLFAGLDKALAGIAWEAIFVDDDSPDGTAVAVRELGQRILGHAFCSAWGGAGCLRRALKESSRPRRRSLR